jgi:hypothetical protein
MSAAVRVHMNINYYIHGVHRSLIVSSFMSPYMNTSHSCNDTSVDASETRYYLDVMTFKASCIA